MITTLSVLNSTGDLKLTWDSNNSAECEAMRETVADLKAKGYSFFLVDGSPADEVSAGSGGLLVRRLAADELVETTTGPIAEASPTPKRRGRPPKAKVTADTESGLDRRVVAVRPVRGG